MGKISVDAFLREYKVAAKQKDSVVEDFVKKHITTKYIGFLTKSAYCTSIVKASTHIKDGDREIIKINSDSRYLFFVMRLIQLYTDIEFKNEDTVSVYDKLNEVGAINELIAAIPEAEYSEFSTLLNMKMDDFRENEYSLTALAYNLKESFSLSEELIGEVLNSPEVQAKIEEIKKADIS